MLNTVSNQSGKYVPPTISERCRHYAHALISTGGEWRDSMLPPLLLEAADRIEKLEEAARLVK